METCGAVADFDRFRQVTLWETTQAPHATHDVAELRRLPENKIA